MATFFEQIETALDAAQIIYGKSFTRTLSTGVTFKGIFERNEYADIKDIGSFDDEWHAKLLVTKVQFTDLSTDTVPKKGELLTVDLVNYRIVRVNEDEVSYEILLKLKTR